MDFLPEMPKEAVDLATIVGAFAAIIAAWFSFRTIQLTRRRWRNEDDLKAPSFTLHASGSRRKDGWCHVTYNVENNRDYNIIVDSIAVCRPWFARLNVQASQERGDHLTAPVLPTGKRRLFVRKSIRPKSAGGGDIFIKTGKSVAKLQATIRPHQWRGQTVVRSAWVALPTS